MRDGRVERVLEALLHIAEHKVAGLYSVQLHSGECLLHNVEHGFNLVVVQSVGRNVVDDVESTYKRSHAFPIGAPLSELFAERDLVFVQQVLELAYLV